jgi:hypothetical protein
MTYQESILYVWIIVGTLAAGSALFLIALWVIGKRLGTNLRPDHDQSEGYAVDHSEGYVVRGSAAKAGRGRTLVGTLAIFLGLLALWILGSELASPRLGYFPSSPDEADAMYAVRGPAITAAKVGLIRGDLWTVAAITATAPFLFETAGSSHAPASQTELQNIRAIAARAARLSPHDSRIWLVLACLDLRTGGTRAKGIRALKLSYYTGPNEFSLMPARLLLAAGSDAIFDEDVQNLAPLDIQQIILRRPDLKPAIGLVYQNALPKGRAVIEATLKQTDPGFLATIAPKGTK